MAMLRSETIVVAFDALRANKVRAFLTTLGVVIGSACIVLVVTIALSGRRYVMAMALSYEINLGDMESVAGIPQVAVAAGTRDIRQAVVVAGVERPISFVGVTEGFQQIRKLIVLRGRFFDAEDMQLRSKVCLLTKELADRVFPYEDPVGRTIRVSELSFTVIGVFKERVATFGLTEIQRDSVLVPFSLMKYYTGEDVLGVLYAQARSPEEVVSVTRQVESILRSRHPAGAVYDVHDLGAILDAAKSVSRALTIVLVLVAFIALLISGVGIMNIMLVTVTERTREIGIRRAIGAPRSEILYQFLVEAIMISGTGAVAGILIGVSIPVLLQPLLPGNVRVPVSWLSVVVAFLVSCLTGVFFGYLPANRAAKLQPTESLRYE